ncbi:MAG TPA: hypothetical protein VK153_00135 [Candidatus Paceibacterota bacterium]|nr:hypothetical protein [Candidatus Paceibacterota bacterium]
MKKYINLSVSSIIIILSLFVGVVSHAEEEAEETTSNTATVSNTPVACTMDAKLCPDGSYVGRVGPNCEFAKCPEPREVKTRANIEARNALRVENKEKRDEVKNEIKNLSAENKAKLEAMITSVKEQREEFKANLEVKKEEAKTKMAEMKEKLKTDLNVIKDEKKKTSAEKIVTSLQALNVKLTTNLSAKVDQIENVLVSIQSRITKGEEKGLDVTSVKAEVEKAKIAIENARKAISTQTSKTYEVKVTSESTLKTEMQALRDLFNKDIKIVRDQVKLAHTAVKNVATSLAKIPKINDEVETEVEVNNTTSVNQ